MTSLDSKKRLIVSIIKGKACSSVLCDDCPIPETCEEYRKISFDSFEKRALLMIKYRQLRRERAKMWLLSTFGEEGVFDELL